MPLRVVAQLRHSYGSCSIIICISMGSCSMAREVVTQRTVLHHYCSTKIRFEPPTQSVTCMYMALLHCPCYNLYIHTYIHTIYVCMYVYINVCMLQWPLACFKVLLNFVIGASLSEPHTSKSLQNVRSTVSRNLVNHSVFGRTYVQQCHGIRYTSQDFARSIVSRNSRSTVSRNLVNQSIFGCTYVQQCYGFCDTCQNIVN